MQYHAIVEALLSLQGWLQWQGREVIYMARQEAFRNLAPCLPPRDCYWFRVGGGGQGKGSGLVVGMAKQQKCTPGLLCPLPHLGLMPAKYLVGVK